MFLENMWDLTIQYSRTFKDFISVMDALSNEGLRLQIINLVTLERYLRAILYDIENTSPN